jgi:hypothetical protein
MTIEIVRADPERRLLVLWLLAGAAVVATCIGVHSSARRDATRHHRDDPGVVSLIERLRDGR